MILKGKKVRLRAIEQEDLEFVRSLINDPEIEKTIVGWALPISRNDEGAPPYHRTGSEITLSPIASYQPLKVA